ncbi:SMI1/KNR4 family protein [Pseudomonas sp. UBA6562]|uniref:SMI1/KNR4 family protein n=1 Tax=Pseudomonas sp. UBA6562 TaxID=1947332 RepID=UPI0025EF0906|nr:SMI1/KNR4 family protein [Pseudomonas sp. UBA6562]
MNPLSPQAIDSLEQQLGFPLPPFYRQLLSRFGPGRRDDLELYHPQDIAALYAHHFEAPDQLFRMYFPFGCNHHTQEIWLIRMDDLKVASLWHEAHPDDYADESWVGGERWLRQVEPVLSPPIQALVEP